MQWPLGHGLLWTKEGGNRCKWMQRPTILQLKPGGLFGTTQKSFTFLTKKKYTLPEIWWENIFGEICEKFYFGQQKPWISILEVAKIYFLGNRSRRGDNIWAKQFSISKIDENGIHGLALHFLASFQSPVCNFSAWHNGNNLCKKNRFINFTFINFCDFLWYPVSLPMCFLTFVTSILGRKAFMAAINCWAPRGPRGQEFCWGKVHFFRARW